MTGPNVRIWIPDRWDSGHRHDLARDIWRTAAKAWDVDLVLHPHAASHKQALRDWWHQAAEEPGIVHIFTETDFLPLPSFRDVARSYAAAFGLTGPMARHRGCGADLPADHSTRAGAWILIAAPERIRKLSFNSCEPGASLPEECPGMNILTGEWEDPGLFYPGLGLHTFWSRAWHGDFLPPEGFDHTHLMERIDAHLDHYRKIWNV